LQNGTPILLLVQSEDINYAEYVLVELSELEFDEVKRLRFVSLHRLSIMNLMGQEKNKYCLDSQSRRVILDFGYLHCEKRYCIESNNGVE